MRPLLLVLRALGLGDLATVVPAVRGLRRAFPEHELVLATPAVLAPLVDAIGGVDRLLPTRSYVRTPVDRLSTPGRRPDLAVNLHGKGPQSHRVLMAHCPVGMLAFASPPAFVDGPQWSDEQHEVPRWCELLGWYGISADPADLAVPRPAPIGDWAGAVVVHPGASGAERCWPATRFAGLARLLAADGHRVLVSGLARERARADAVVRGAKLPTDAMLAGRTDLASLCALIAHAALVICGDTGVAHLATAYGTPSVVLFGPVSPATWGPPADRAQHAALWHGPHGLKSITVADVYAAAIGRLATHAAAAG
jgi:ADP-heptose:LPS heptosyltransferase